MIRGLARATVTLAIGAAAAGGLFWALLNVPESNVMALTLSAGIIATMVAVSGLAIGAAAAFVQRTPLRQIGGRAAATLLHFAIGLLLFAMLWLITGSATNWWTAHRGEIDAVILRYLGRTETAWLHTSAFWAFWLIRWALGLSFVAGLVSAGVSGGVRGIARGLRLSVALAPLAVATVVVLLVARGLWPITYWRPGSLPPTWVQPAFAAVKLGVLFLLASSLAAIVLIVYGSSGRSRV
jgi:hypothetical protein